ncbi:MAG: type II toxin-antitoxin system prevent-host-death family antitoxin [Dehalococcoidia bacterium]|nr:type II toxin-antitoxin system prevent-host-death family antitoxin [Dehalococcoidia bacterium]
MGEREQPTTQTMKASEAREQFSQLLNRVFRRETRVLVEKSGIPVAAIISPDDLKRFNLIEEERAERFKVLDESWKAFEGVSPESVEMEAAKAVASARRKPRGTGRSPTTRE